jgi:hypothetical protein
MESEIETPANSSQTRMKGVQKLLRGTTMPFDSEFKQHLHSLMVEVYEETHDSEMGAVG